MRGLIAFGLLAVAAIAASVWLAEHPGLVVIDWLGWQLSTSVGIAVLALVVLLGLGILLYRIWQAVMGAPGRLSQSAKLRREHRGYEAVTRSFAAVASGDAEEAERWARKAGELLGDQPLARMVMAEAAEAGEDRVRAARHYRALLEAPETRLYALRGLTRLALEAGEQEAAQDFMRQAYDLKPDTPWVLDRLFQLSESSGDFAAAEKALKEARRRRAMTREEAKRKQAVLRQAKAQALAAEGKASEARRAASDALSDEPGLVPALALKARLERDAGDTRRAAATLEKGWARAPHPQLAALYRSLRADEDPLARVKRIEKLTAKHPGHPESEIALAEAYLEAKLFGEARRHLTAAKALGETPSQRGCRLMAEIEEREHADRAAAAEWLRKAEGAEPDATWICRQCGTQADDWSAHCPNCQAFDSLEWRSPRRVARTLPVAAAPAAGGATDAEVEVVEPELVPEPEAPKRAG
ncbi:HemY protein [Tistlia consotensis]|uniref:HemY protein n=1 Tax=Tistlia consotensis USBA 355 TaxID=560819 RepID=A0A1Y6CS04_9PROT|nr:heme biosynthesis HemY N-terminal domain-containing protein [Tistlia consotensis]SMF83785.1 HemY protein [Tistlia consotensis USBA 355]SNS34408.1 HemY protein [Tistlia consotensis]